MTPIKRHSWIGAFCVAVAMAMTLGTVRTSEAAASCSGQLIQVFVESDGALYMTMAPSALCGCNFQAWGGYSFRTPPTQPNVQEMYAAALAALLSGKPLAVWMDWSHANSNVLPCLAHNAALRN